MVANALLFFENTPIHSLPLSQTFVDSGVYALYYLGDYPLYAPISLHNQSSCILPIYVGKAVPPGWRTSRSPNATAPTLFNRLQEHARSIQQGADIHVAHFRCRFMILNVPESDLITVIEAELIRRFKPLWNSTVDGFGNHDPGVGRKDQAKSEWDILHPGRLWAEKLIKTATTREVIIAKVRQILA